MLIDWSLKDVLYTLGSVAGVIAFFRPLAESKIQRDAVRIERIKGLFNEQQLVDIERCINSRQVPRSHFLPFSQLDHELETNQEVVRFSGPFAGLLKKELTSLIQEYQKLRVFVQVPEWEPRSIEVDGERFETWDFNKSAFENKDRIPEGYADHLYAAEKQAAEVLKAFQRFQVVSELHLLELPFAKWLVNRRFKSRGLCASKT